MKMSLAIALFLFAVNASASSLNCKSAVNTSPIRGLTLDSAKRELVPLSRMPAKFSIKSIEVGQAAAVISGSYLPLYKCAGSCGVSIFELTILRDGPVPNALLRITTKRFNERKGKTETTTDETLMQCVAKNLKGPAAK